MEPDFVKEAVKVIAAGKKKGKFLVKVRRAFRRPLVGLCLLGVFIGGFVHYGATKGTNGLNRLMMVLPPATVLPPSETDVSGLSFPEDFPPVTNLCFWGILPGPVSVTLGLAWPEGTVFSNDRIDIFGNWDLRNPYWRRLCTVDVSGAESNAVVQIARADFPTNAMDTLAFFRAASNEDSDGDGLTDAEERLVTHTDPALTDTDGDGDDDGWEFAHCLDPLAEDEGIRPYGDISGDGPGDGPGGNPGDNPGDGPGDGPGGGGTRVESLNADGSTASVTGTAVMPVYTTRGVAAIERNGETVNCTWTTERVGAADSPRFRTVYVDGFGETVRVETAGFGNAVNVQDRFYDGCGRLVRQTETGLPTKEYAYDAFGDQVGETASAGNETRTTATARAFVLEDGAVCESTTTTRSCSDPAIAPLVESRRIRRSGLTLAENACVVATDARGNSTVVRVAVDPALQSRVETVQRPETSNIATNWYADGAIVSNVSHAGVCEQRRLDAYRRETARIDGRGNTTTRSYNPQGRLARVVDASDAGTGYAYDAMGRIVEVTNALDQVSTRAYDLRGNLVAEGGAVYPVQYGYDVFGDRVSLTTFRDASAQPGDTTIWTRDPATGLVTAKTYADGHGPAYAYDARGRLASRTWARGVVTTYAYDAWGMLVGMSYSDGTPAVAYAYSAVGKVSEASVAGGARYAYGYDSRLLCTNEAVSAGADRVDVVRTYDGRSRCDLVAAVVTNVAHAVKTRRFDAYGRVVGYGITNVCGRGMAASLLYTGSRLDGIAYTLPNGGTFASAFTRSSSRPDLVTRRDYRFGTGSVYWYETGYDLAGRPTNAVDSVSLARAYLYNRRNELAEALVGTNAFGYAYDTIGNRTSDTLNGMSRNYAANCLNQYAQVDAAQMVYDADGNLVRDDRLAYTYDAENRMLSARPI